LVLKKKSERDKAYGTGSTTGSIDNTDTDIDMLRTNLIARMKSLTNASDDICVSILQRHSYDLETSVEAYLSNSITTTTS
jgi:hypothetical protein